MKPFRFSLEVLRTVRERQERSAMEKYARATIARQKAMDGLRAALNAVDTAWSELQKRVALGSPAGEVSRDRLHCQELEARQKLCESSLRKTEEEVDSAWRGWVFARQQRETVDRVREIQKTDHDKWLQQEEQKLLDEMAGRKPGRFSHKFRRSDTLWN